MLQYLVSRYDKDHKISYPVGSKEHWETTSWVRCLVLVHSSVADLEAHVADGRPRSYAGPGKPLRTYGSRSG